MTGNYSTPPRSNSPGKELTAARLASADKLAWWMDRSIPLGHGWSIGWAGIIGLIPGIGDLIAALIAVGIVIRAIQLGVPRVAVVRMIVNIAIEAIVGTIPIFGDIFDFAFKGNTRNVKLLRAHLAGHPRQTTKDWQFLALVGLVLLIILAVPIILIVLVLRLLLSMNGQLV